MNCNRLMTSSATAHILITTFMASLGFMAISTPAIVLITPVSREYFWLIFFIVFLIFLSTSSAKLQNKVQSFVSNCSFFGKCGVPLWL